MAAALVFADKPPLPMDCKVCHRDPAKRQEWGCDQELDAVPESLDFDCFLCERENPDPECPACDGAGWWGPKRCPNKIVGYRETKICEQSRLLEYHLPSAGGWEDQSYKWQQAIGVVTAERAAYEKEARDIERSKMKTGAK